MKRRIFRELLDTTVSVVLLVIVWQIAVMCGLSSRWAVGTAGCMAGILIFTGHCYVSRLVPYLPVWYQRPFYEEWKKRVLVDIETQSPLIAYPQRIFWELQADEIFKARGMRGVKRASDVMFEDIQKKLTRVINEKSPRKT